MKIAKTNSIAHIASEMNRISEAVLFSHVSPDGDCLGSMLALGLALESMGKKIRYYNPGPLPVNLRFLPGLDPIMTTKPGQFPDTLVFIDCAEADRVYNGIASELFEDRTVINIDHHVSNDCFGTINWVDPNVAATGEMIYKLIKKLGVPITHDIAVNLYTAIITDTGRFSFSNTTADSFKIAAGLVKTGIDLVEINNVLFEKKSLSQTNLLKIALTNLEIHQDGKIALIVLSKEDFEKSGAEENLSEGLVNYARNIENVEAAALLKEIDDREVKVSFRSNSWLDVSEVAQRFGGGGHIRASGCTINASLKGATQEVKAVLEEALRVGRDN